MKNRIQKIIDHYHLNSNSFANEIEVNRSTISHILTGRNKPSIEVLQKILKRFNDISAEWLLLGTGEINTKSLDTPISELSYKNKSDKEIDKIIIIYTDQTFMDYKASY